MFRFLLPASCFLLPAVLAAGVGLASSPTAADTAHVTYEPVNLATGDNGHALTGDIIIRRPDGHVEFAEFLARSSGQFMSPGSLNYPPTDVSMVITNQGGGPIDPGGGFHVQSEESFGGGEIQLHPAVVGGTCAALYGLLRSWCSFDCRNTGVNEWSAGFCGAGATCVCFDPPPPLPPAGRPMGPIGMGSPFVVPFSWTSFWLRP